MESLVLWWMADAILWVVIINLVTLPAMAQGVGIMEALLWLALYALITVAVLAVFQINDDSEEDGDVDN